MLSILVPPDSRPLPTLYNTLYTSCVHYFAYIRLIDQRHFPTSCNTNLTCFTTFLCQGRVEMQYAFLYIVILLLSCHGD